MRLLRADDDSVLCDSHGGPVCRLNHTATALWELCDGGTQVEEMVAAVCLVAGIEEERARDDVHRTLADLAERGAIEWA
ncbi:MAG: PqqD family protein [Acidimicrobiales bacterium]